jgi:excisionase family DNA binding protein
MQKLLTDKQTAEYLGIGVSTVWKLTKENKLSRVNPVGRSTRWHVDDLDKYITSCRIGG